MRKRGALFQRRYFRIPFNDPMEFHILQYNRRYLTHLSTKRGPAVCHDLGEDGLSFISPYCLPPEMVLRVVLKLPGYTEQRILARVVRSGPVEDGYLTAVQFINLNGPRKDSLRNFIIGETRKNYKFLRYL